MRTPQQVGQAGWQARLELEFGSRAGRTVITRRYHYGPLAVQKPFYPEKDGCHVYLLHPPGGVVGGDHLRIEIDVTTGAHALMTTPASTKFYRSSGALSVQENYLKVVAGATLEWLPQETILFANCRASLVTRVALAADARFIGWEVLCLGRPAANEYFDKGACWQRFELWQEDIPLMVERTHLKGSGSLLSAPWGLMGHTVLGTLVAVPANDAILEAVRESVTPGRHALFSTTLLDEVLVCRYLGDQGEAAHHCFTSAWSAIRPNLLGRSACYPRIWYT
jgi:Urease accessory protein UreH